MFEKFTRSAREAVVDAQRHAIESRSDAIGTRALLTAMLSTPGPLADLLRQHGATPETRSAALSSEDEAALRSLGIDLSSVREAVESTFGAGALDRPAADRTSRLPWRRGAVRHLPFSKHAKKALELSLRESIRLGSGDIRLEHIALGVLRAEDPDLAGLKIDVRRLRDAIELRLREAA